MPTQSTRHLPYNLAKTGSLNTFSASKTNADSTRRPLRIVHVANDLKTGGLERLLVEFAQHRDRTRVEMSFVALGVRGAIAAELELYGCVVTAFNIKPGVRVSTLAALTRHLRALRPDIVHTHNIKPLLYAGPAARLAGVAGVLHTRHGLRQGSSRRHNWLFRLATHFVDGIVNVSDDTARACLRDGVNSSRVHRIWNGIDLARFRAFGHSVNGPCVYVGRLAPEKNVESLLRAAALVVEQVPHFQLDIAGDGPSCESLKALSRELGLGEHVRFLGEQADIPALLRTASMLVLPSLTEGLPLTVLEAMACGLPVIATRVGGTPEALRDGETGLLVTPGDTAELAEALMLLSANEVRRIEMGIEGRRRVEQFFDVRSMVSEYCGLYRSIISQRRSAAA